jgi:hypothetical protein
VPQTKSAALTFVFTEFYKYKAQKDFFHTSYFEVRKGVSLSKEHDIFEL